MLVFTRQQGQLQMLQELKNLSGMTPDTQIKGYDIMRYYHPDGGGRVEFVKHVPTLEKAQAHCQDPATSYKTGPTSDWWFDGYVEAGSRSRYITLWGYAKSMPEA